MFNRLFFLSIMLIYLTLFSVFGDPPSRMLNYTLRGGWYKEEMK